MDNNHVNIAAQKRAVLDHAFEGTFQAGANVAENYKVPTFLVLASDMDRSINGYIFCGTTLCIQDTIKFLQDVIDRLRGGAIRR